MEVFGPGGAERDIFFCLKVILACCSTEMNLITTNINYNSGSHALDKCKVEAPALHASPEDLLIMHYNSGSHALNVRL